MEELVYCDTNAIKWYVSDMSFRTNGPCEIRNSGSVLFSQLDLPSYNQRIGPKYINRKRGPAIIHPDGYVRYKGRYGLTHRTDGPAVIFPDGHKEYWVENNKLSDNEFFLKYGVL